MVKKKCVIKILFQFKYFGAVVVLACTSYSKELSKHLFLVQIPAKTQHNHFHRFFNEHENNDVKMISLCNITNHIALLNQSK